MQSKKARHQKILQIIREKQIDKQEELVAQLRAAGFQVTQATVSRDIRDLCLIKEPAPDGSQCYARSDRNEGHYVNIKLKEIFGHSVVRVDWAGNIVVVKTLSGMAQGAAAAVDAMEFGEIVGSIAGDDTIMIVTRNDQEAEALCARLNESRG